MQYFGLYIGNENQLPHETIYGWWAGLTPGSLFLLVAPACVVLLTMTLLIIVLKRRLENKRKADARASEKKDSQTTKKSRG
jgi:hypothetical protein